MLIIARVSKDFALYVTFGGFIGEESDISIVGQFVVIGNLFCWLD